MTIDRTRVSMEWPEGSVLRRAPNLVECSAVTVLKRFIILSLNLSFVIEVWWMNGLCL